MRTSIKTIRLQAALTTGLTGLFFTQVPDLAKDRRSLRSTTSASKR